MIEELLKSEGESGIRDKGPQSQDTVVLENNKEEQDPLVPTAKEQEEIIWKEIQK